MSLANISQSISAFFEQLSANFESFIRNQLLLENLLSALLLLSIVFALFCSVVVYLENERENNIYRKVTIKKERKSFFKDVLLKDLYSNINDLMKERGKDEKETNKIVMILMLLILGVSLFMIVVRQILLGCIFPIVLTFTTVKITNLMKKTQDDYIQEQLPGAIDNIVRTFTKYSDLRTILYEASGTLKDPMRSMIAGISGKMLNQSPNIVIEDFADEVNNIWINSLCFILLNYLEATPKKEVVENLRNLRDIISRENKSKKKEKLERKMTVLINYAICGVAILGFAGNLLINPMAQSFFFSTLPGLICFVVGLALLITAIFSNLIIGSGK